MFQFRSVLLACLLSLFSGLAMAEITRVPETELTMNKELREDIFRTLQYLNFMHYLPNNLDDEYSSKVLDGYLDLLDPNKIFFTQADVDQFESHRFKLDDYLKKHNAEVAFDIYKQYRTIMDKRISYALELIQDDFDFKKQESINIDREERQWASSEKAIKERWRKRIKNDTLIQVLSDTPIDEIRKNLTRRYERQRDIAFQLKADEVFEWFMNAYSKELEPHTQYMSHITSENFRINMSLSLEGIGAALQTDQDYTVINRIIPGGPAERSGLISTEDKIVGVGQENEEIINVIGWRLMDVVRMIRGKKGSKVTLQILPDEALPGSPPETITLVRDVIQLEDQAAKLTEFEFPDGDKTRTIASIRIPSFYANANNLDKNSKYTSTSQDVKKLLQQVNESDAEGLVIDLRGNGGGYLTEAVKLTGLFISEGPVVQVVESNRKRQVLKDREPNIYYDGPLLVLVDRYSASASEIFAAAMQDYGRAIVVGERSFGKGTVQRVAPLRYGTKIDHESQVKFTTAVFFRVNGDSTQHKGVIPDVMLNAGEEDEEFGERAYDNALPWSQTSASEYEYQEYPQDLIAYLSKQHLARSKTSPAFEYLRQNSKAVNDNKNTKVLSLNKKQRQKKRSEIEDQTIVDLNKYRASLGLKAVTAKNRKDNPLPNKDDHWDLVFQKEAANILLDLQNWPGTVAKTELKSAQIN